MKLFICMTPLQTIIAHRIIQEEKLNKRQCALVYLSMSPNGIHKVYYERLVSMVDFGVFISTGRSLKTIFKLRKLLLNKKADVYVASINDTLIFYALSFLDLRTLVTYDDGTANIISNSVYFSSEKNFSLRRKLMKTMHFLLGNRFSLDKVKASSTLHYTIYKDYENVIACTKYIPLFCDPLFFNGKKGSEMNVFLGTVYSEIVENIKHIERLQNDVKNMLHNIGNCIYIPHPRESANILFSERYPVEDLMAEELIMELLKKYDTINIYGFGSSAQFNLLNLTERLRIYPIDTPILKKEVRDAVKALAKYSNSCIRC
ncbi:hypothetical protein A4G18_07965 [Pasteurellaceae bacterium Pebbles2]|nr:hypothetical protein [Pasteurellaceae bacterium Pebbles2]